MKSTRDEFFGKNPVEYAFSETLVQSGFSRTYKPREVFFKKLLDSLHVKETDRVLDVGSGDGIVLERIIQQFGCTGVGVDVSRQSIERSKSHYSSNRKSSYRVARAEKLPFKDRSFDVVVSFDTLEHVGVVGDPKATIRLQHRALRELYRVLKPGGRFLVYTINKHQEYTWNQLMARIGFDIYGPFDHYHDLFLDPDWVKKAFQSMNAKNLSLQLFNSFFTLMVDEAIMMVSRYVARLHSKPSEWNFIRAMDYISKSLYGILFFMEYPWRLLGRSNSFAVTGVKYES